MMIITSDVGSYSNSPLTTNNQNNGNYNMTITIKFTTYKCLSV